MRVNKFGVDEGFGSHKHELHSHQLSSLFGLCFIGMLPRLHFMWLTPKVFEVDFTSFEACWYTINVFVTCCIQRS